MERKTYRKREEQKILAVQLNLKTDGFSYEKWGNLQQCNAGDWIVNNNGDCYTISEVSFRKTYTEFAPGQYVKTGVVWAEQATKDSKVKTKEGYTNYQKGDYIVSNEEDGSDAYAVSRSRFEELYVPIEQ